MLARNWFFERSAARRRRFVSRSSIVRSVTFEILVELRVLDCHRGLIRDRGEQQDVVRRERVLAIALDRDHADDPVARHHRNAEPGLARLRVGNGAQAQSPLVGRAAEEERLMVLHDPGVESFAER
jgi:hypothetical protein